MYIDDPLTNLTLVMSCIMNKSRKSQMKKYFSLHVICNTYNGIKIGAFTFKNTQELNYTLPKIKCLYSN